MVLSEHIYRLNISIIFSYSLLQKQADLWLLPLYRHGKRHNFCSDEDPHLPEIVLTPEIDLYPCCRFKSGRFMSGLPYFDVVGAYIHSFHWYLQAYCILRTLCHTISHIFQSPSFLPIFMFSFHSHTFLVGFPI